MKRAIALIRVSSSEQDTESQIESLCKIAKKKGYNIDKADILQEKISGYDEDESKDRKSIIELEQKITLNKPDAIFVWELSRLTRRAIKVQRYIDRFSVLPKIPMYFADYDVWTLDEKTKKTEDDNIMMLVGGAKSVEIERKRIRERTKRGRDNKAEKGFYVGHLADGYSWELQNGNKVIIRDEERAKLIKRIFEMYAEQGYSASMIRDVLNSEVEKYPPTNRYRKQLEDRFKGYKGEYRDRSGNLYSRDEMLWTDGTITQILREEWYHGTRYYHGEPYSVPKIIDDVLWQKAQERLDTFPKIVSKAKRKYLLTDYIYCGNCGRKMYAHGNEYLNMYYCSSQEYGRNQKCGLRWLRQENVDSIVYNIIKARAKQDCKDGEKTPFTSFFEIDDEKIKAIEAQIKVHKSIIKRADENIKTHNETISFYMEQQGIYHKNQNRVSQYETLIKSFEDKIEEEEKTKRNHSYEIEKLKKQKKIMLSVEDKLSKVDLIKDFDEMRAFVSSMLSKVIIYNPDLSSSVIRIEYTNGEADYAIYNAMRLKRKYIFLSQKYSNWMKMRYDIDRKVIAFDGCYYAASPSDERVFDRQNEVREPYTVDGKLHIPLGTWNTEDNRKRYEAAVDDAIEKGLISNKEQYLQLYAQAVDEGLIWNDIEDAKRCLNEEGFTVFKDYITTQDYVSLKRRDGTFNVYDYADLLPMSEKGIERMNWHREYQKRYNTGKTFTAFVEKGVDYDRICLERKHLYNRKYKILHNKKLTPEQKEKQILDIMEKLEAYKYQLKYLPSNKKGLKHMEKYNKSQDND